VSPETLPSLEDIPIKDRLSFLFLERGELDIKDGAFVLTDSGGVRMQIPIGDITCLLLEPGTTISHAAVVTAARVGTWLVWVGEAAVRLYSAGHPGGARSDRLLQQVKVALDETSRLKVARRMYEIRFGETPPAHRSIEQLRGIEGARVRRIYQTTANLYKVPWHGRCYDDTTWGSGDVPNRCMSAATACLYGITEAAILAAGYSPGIGFIHTGKPLSFVYDIADIFKFDTVVPTAFQVAAKNPSDPERMVRLALRDAFRKYHVLPRIIPLIEEVISAGGVEPIEQESL
jgi:CRISPR-associated protein Cas1